MRPLVQVALLTTVPVRLATRARTGTRAMATGALPGAVEPLVGLVPTV